MPRDPKASRARAGKKASPASLRLRLWLVIVVIFAPRDESVDLRRTFIASSERLAQTSDLGKPTWADPRGLKPTRN
jgi:hypothetical protein